MCEIRDWGPSEIAAGKEDVYKRQLVSSLVDLRIHCIITEIYDEILSFFKFAVLQDKILTCPPVIENRSAVAYNQV